MESARGVGGEGVGHPGGEGQARRCASGWLGAWTRLLSPLVCSAVVRLCDSANRLNAQHECVAAALLRAFRPPAEKSTLATPPHRHSARAHTVLLRVSFSFFFSSNFCSGKKVEARVFLFVLIGASCESAGEIGFGERALCCACWLAARVPADPPTQ